MEKHRKGDDRTHRTGRSCSAARAAAGPGPLCSSSADSDHGQEDCHHGPHRARGTDPRAPRHEPPQPPSCAAPAPHFLPLRKLIRATGTCSRPHHKVSHRPAEDAGPSHSALGLSLDCGIRLFGGISQVTTRLLCKPIASPVGKEKFRAPPKNKNKSLGPKKGF